MNLIRRSIQSNISQTLSPAQFLVVAYLVVLSIGTLLLQLPAASVGQSLNFIDALFMAASALCVTGLAVITIGTELTVFGQLVILSLIQVGALGVMTMSSLFALILGRRIGLRNRIFLQEDLNQSYLSGVVRLVRYVIVVTLSFEAIGAFFLYLGFVNQMPVGQALYFGIFHSVSAFANAGFDLFGTSFETYVNHTVVTFVIALLFILGGLGFSVISELIHYHNRRKLTLHSKIVLLTTLVLVAISWLFVLIFEFGNLETLGGLSLESKLSASFFTAVTPRTAGFNVVPTGSLQTGTLFFILILMFIGASPGSTGGGIKTTTFLTLLLGVWKTICGKRDVEVCERRISDSLVSKAWAITFLALLWIVLVTMILLSFEPFEFMETIFEVISAFGTVGLSTGITGDLSPFSRILITITMFIGRLGPMTLALALGQQRKANGAARYPEEKITLG